MGKGDFGVDLLGVEDFRLKDLRHTFASRLVMKGASLKAVQELLGHADLTITRRCAHLEKERLKDSANLLNDMPGIYKTLNIPQKEKRLTTPKLPTSGNSSQFMVGTRGFEPPTP